MKIHIKRLHPIEYENLMASTGNQLRTDDQEYVLRFTKSELDKFITRLVTKDGRPLSIVQDSALRTFLFDKIGVHYDGDKVKDLINNAYETVKERISKKLDNRLISIKIDAKTQYLKSYLGINAQIIEDGKIVMVQLTESHTALYIKVRI